MASKLLSQAFGVDVNLYDVLEVDQNVTDSKLRKAYYKKALVYHPDKNKDDDDAQLKFQAISLAYQVWLRYSTLILWKHLHYKFYIDIV